MSMSVPVLLIGVPMVLLGLFLSVVDGPSLPEITTLIVGIILLVWADWMSKHHTDH